MSWRRPSLSRRVALSFVFSTFVLGLLLAALSFYSFDANYSAVSSAAADLARDVRRAPAGGLSLSAGSPFAGRDGAGPWAVVRDERGATLILGAPPPEAVRLAESAPVALTKSSALHFQLASAGRDPKVRLDDYETSAGRVLIVIGGVDPEEAGLRSLLAMAQANAYIAAIPVVLVLAIVLWLIVAPLVFKGVRPLAAAAAAIDGSDPARRLPEAGVTAELLPIVKAFNGALDRLEEMLERRRRFMADAAHELRTPLAVLNMQVEQLPLTSARTDLQRAVFRMSQMVGQMLDAEQLKGPERQREPMDLSAVVREAATEVAPLALAAGYEFDLAIEPDRLPIEGNPHAVRRAVNNLLGNAVAHGGGAGLIQVRLSRAGVVEVSDEGPGVGDAERDRVFEPFHRERWDKDGCGLGLYLVREIMKAHGGRAELAERDGGGALFRLIFPTAQAT